MASVRLAKLLLKLVANLKLFCWTTQVSLHRSTAERLCKELDEQVHRLMSALPPEAAPGKVMKVEATCLGDHQFKAYLASAADFLSSAKFQSLLQKSKPQLTSGMAMASTSATTTATAIAADMVVCLRRAQFALGPDA